MIYDKNTRFAIFSLCQSIPVGCTQVHVPSLGNVNYPPISNENM